MTEIGSTNVKRRLFYLLIVLSAALGSFAQGPVVLSSARAIAQLDNGSASHSLPVDFQATLTYFRPYEQTMFVEDGGTAIFILGTTEVPLAPGDRIRVRGTTKAGLRPYVESHDISLVGHGKLPAPRPVTFKDLITSADDCMRIVVRGRVRAAVEETKTDVRGVNRPRWNSVRMEVLTDGGVIDVLVDETDGRNLDQYLDAEVEITGIAGGKFDGKMQQTGVVIHVRALTDVKVLQKPAADPWSIPATAMETVMRAYQVRDLTQRVRVRGTVTFYQPGTAIVLQNGSKSLWIATHSRIRLHQGDVVDAIGFPDTYSGFLTLSDAVIKDLNVNRPITPAAVKWEDLAASRRVFDLVTIEGTVMTENRETGQDEYVISSDGHLFTTIFRHNVLYRFSDDPLPPLKAIEPGSKVRITGICVPQDANPFAGKVPFSILLPSMSDIAVVQIPPWLNIRHLIFLTGFLLLSIFGLGLRAWLVERKVRRQNASSAYIEKRRGKILEDINNSRPLAEILERVTELVSARLAGAVCWCQLVDGPRLGNAPAKGFTGLRVVERTIPSRSGAVLGTISAAFAAATLPGPEESQALTLAAGLATLAIETSRLYSDLVHRSEFDLLTDVQNRFSLEKFLAWQIEAARQSAGIFGLLYIDLDHFKQVNDVYGHQVGDRYLQKAADRMKHQLRPGDLLARLGGDEFAVVVRSLGSDSHLEEIATRLEHCFDEAFDCDGVVLYGSASVGFALYPDDAVTLDALVKAADLAMYARKNQRREQVAGSAPR